MTQNTQDLARAKGGRGAATLQSWLQDQLRNIAPFITLLCLVVFFGVASPSFASWANLQNILVQVSVTGIMATGLTFVLLTGEMDLSFANVANAAGVIVAYFTLQDATVNIANIPLPGGAAIVIAILGALIFGAINAFGITRIGIPSFIMTLAMLEITAGVSAILVRGQIAYRIPTSSRRWGPGASALFRGW